jgi:hypothetical protein
MRQPALILSIVFAAVPTVCADDPRSAAATDGVRQLTEQVYDCRLSDGRDIRESIRTAGVDLRMRQLIRAHCVIAPMNPQTIDSNGVSPMPRGPMLAVVQLSAADLVKAANDSATETSLKSLLGQISDRQFVALGIADRADSPSANTPLGWETVSADGIAMAVEIARDDALRQMLAALAKHGNADAPEADLQKRRDAFKSAATSAAPVMHACQACTITVPFEIDGIQYGAVGYGVPPWREVKVWQPSGDLGTPSWATQTLVATGKGATNANEIDERKLAIARSTAKADALIKIAIKVDELVLPGQNNLSFGEWLKQSHKYDALWSAYLHTAHPTRSEFADGICTIEMSLELDRLWRLILAVDHAENTASQLASPDVR